MYETTRPWAHLVKVVLQMIVCLGAVADVAAHVVRCRPIHGRAAKLAAAAGSSVQIFASPLAVSAAIELAYTLFSPGPDFRWDSPTYLRNGDSRRNSICGCNYRSAPSDRCS